MSLNYIGTTENQIVWVRDEKGRSVGIRDTVTAIDAFGHARRDTALDIVERHCDSEAEQDFEEETTTFEIENGYKIVFSGYGVECVRDEY